MSNYIENDPFMEAIELPKADEDLIRAYRDVGRSVDELTYTPEFDRLVDIYKPGGQAADKSQVSRRLLILRKSGLLPRLFHPRGN